MTILARYSDERKMTVWSERGRLRFRTGENVDVETEFPTGAQTARGLGERRSEREIGL